MDGNPSNGSDFGCHLLEVSQMPLIEPPFTSYKVLFFISGSLDDDFQATGNSFEENICQLAHHMAIMQVNGTLRVG